MKIPVRALALAVLFCSACASPAPPNTMERCGEHVSVNGGWMEGATTQDHAACEQFRQAKFDQHRQKLQQAQEDRNKEFKAETAREEANCDRIYKRGWWRDKNVSVFCVGHYYWKNKERVRIGMTSEQVADLIGPPNENNRTVTAGLVHEQWVYRTWDAYLYFENGRLTSWQD